MLQVGIPMSYSELMRFLIAVLGVRTFSRYEQLQIACFVPAGTDYVLVFQAMEYPPASTRFVFCLPQDLSVLSNFYSRQIEVGMSLDAPIYAPRYEWVLDSPLRIRPEQVRPPTTSMTLYIKNASDTDICFSVQLSVLGIAADQWYNFVWPLLDKCRETLEVAGHVG